MRAASMSRTPPNADSPPTMGTRKRITQLYFWSSSSADWKNGMSRLTSAPSTPKGHDGRVAEEGDEQDEQQDPDGAEQLGLADAAQQLAGFATSSWRSAGP